MKKKGFVIGGLIILAGAAGAGGWYYYKENYGDSAAASGEVAYVTKISTLLGEDSGVLNRFAGVVEPQETVKVNIENNRTVTEVKVKVGDEVKKGQLLFEYDLSSIQDSLKEAQLALDRLKNEALSLNEQISTLEKEKKKANKNSQLSYTIEIETNKLEDYKDIESIQYYTELTDAGLMEPDYMMKCLMLRSRDNARTPMQWDGSEKAGFTDGEPWIKINPNCKEINAASQLDDPDSIFHYYQKLIALRKEKEIIVYGEFEPLCREDDQIFAYMRKLDEERLLTVCNFSEQSAEFEVPAEFEGSRCLITNLDRKVFAGKVVLKPYEAFVLYK